MFLFGSVHLNNCFLFALFFVDVVNTVFSVFILLVFFLNHIPESLKKKINCDNQEFFLHFFPDRLHLQRAVSSVG